jgi:hypothetical protein
MKDQNFYFRSAEKTVNGSLTGRSAQRGGRHCNPGRKGRTCGSPYKANCVASKNCDVLCIYDLSVWSANDLTGMVRASRLEYIVANTTQIKRFAKAAAALLPGLGCAACVGQANATPLVTGNSVTAGPYTITPDGCSASCSGAEFDAVGSTGFITTAASGGTLLAAHSHRRRFGHQRLL